MGYAVQSVGLFPHLTIADNIALVARLSGWTTTRIAERTEHLMETMKLQAKRRLELGTRTARKLRTQGQLPAIIYGHGETPEAVSIDRHELEVTLAHGARTLELEIAGAGTTQYLIKEVQYDHLDHTPIHLDLTRVDIDERVTVRVGIELKGTPKGVSDGGIVDQHLADIEVECRVADIPETLHPIITELGLGESLLVKDLDLPADVTAIPNGDERVATVRVLATIAESEEVTEGEEGEAQPEVIGRTRKDDEDAASKS